RERFMEGFLSAQESVRGVSCESRGALARVGGSLIHCPGRRRVMRPADDIPPEQLIGKRVAFKDDAEHAGCWHRQVGLRTARVLRLGQSLAKKAELLEAEGILLPDSLPEGCDV